MDDNIPVDCAVDRTDHVGLFEKQFFAKQFINLRILGTKLSRKIFTYF